MSEEEVHGTRPSIALNSGPQLRGVVKLRGLPLQTQENRS